MRHFAVCAGVALLVLCSMCLAETGRLAVKVTDSNAVPLPCRVWVQAGGERLFTPVSGKCAVYDKDRSVAVDGAFTIDVPAGEAVVHVERGKEYLPVDKPVTVAASQTTSVTITLKRWVNMAQEGWYSGDFHCHYGRTDADVLKLIGLSDDVNFQPMLSLWNGETRKAMEKWPDWIESPEVFADSTHLITYHNQEIERIGGGPFESVGALLMFGLKKPVRIYPDNHTWPCDMVLASEAKKSSPQCVIDTDKPIWGENVVTMAFGLFDSVQICHNHYNRDRTLQGGWGMAGTDIEDKTDWGPDELFLRTNSTYYRFLNCGFELAATGGSAMGVMPVPLGYNRTYAHLDGPLTEAAYIDAIHKGRTFATSGPMLILTANDKDCGAHIRYATGKSSPIVLKIHLRSIEPIEVLDIIANGRIVASVDLSSNKADPSLNIQTESNYEPDRSGWVAARAIYKGPEGRLRQAHTSPIYITVDGKPTASKADAEFMIRWIDRLMEVSEKPGRYQSKKQKQESQKVFRKARQVYEKIAEKATQFWPDGG